MYFEGISTQYRSYADSFLKYGIEIIRSSQFSHSMSLIFIGMVLIMLIQTCDSRIGVLSRAPKIKIVEKETTESFNTPPAKQVWLFLVY